MEKKLKYLLCLLITCSLHHGLAAQDTSLFFTEIHRNFSDDETDQEYVRQDSLMVKIDQKRTRYRLYNRQGVMLVNCQVTCFTHNQLVRSGKWNAYNPQGEKKEEGYYDNDIKVGIWHYYNEKGTLRREVNMVKIEMPDGRHQSVETGPFEEYDEQGKLKLTGFHKIKQSKGIDTMQMVLEETGEFVMILIRSEFPINSFPSGVWTYYNTDGTIMRREEYLD